MDEKEEKGKLGVYSWTVLAETVPQTLRRYFLRRM